MPSGGEAEVSIAATPEKVAAEEAVMEAEKSPGVLIKGFKGPIMLKETEKFATEASLMVSRGEADVSANQKYHSDIARFASEKDPKLVAAKVEAMVDYYTEVTKEPYFLIMPDSKYMGRWDVVTMIALLFTSLVTPYEVAL